MRAAQSLVRPICSPKLPSIPSSRRTSGSAISSPHRSSSCPTPSSSALSIAKCVHFTKCTIGRSSWRDDRAERLLGNDLGQNRHGRAESAGDHAQPVELRDVGSEHVASPAVVAPSAPRRRSRKAPARIGHPVVAEEIRKVEFGGRAGLHADLLAASSSPALTSASCRTMKPWPSK